MLDCYKDFIGIRQIATPESRPKSGLYIDDLPGINVNTSSKTSNYETGIELIERVLLDACDQTLEEVFNYDPTNSGRPSLRTNPLSKIYNQSRFKKDLVPTTITGEKGISFEFLRADLYQLSKFKISRIHLKADEDVSKVVAKIKDGTKETPLQAVDLVAGEKYTIEEVNHIASSNKIEIVIDQSQGQFILAYLPSNQPAGCSSCGTRSFSGFIDQKTGLKVEGGYGISADVHLICDTDMIKCQLLSYLKFVIRWKAGSILATEGKFSDRGNFWTFNADFDEMKDYYDQEYSAAMLRVVPTLKNLLKQQDKNCFECGGMKAGTILY